MTTESADLAAALVAAYRSYVAERLAARGWSVDEPVLESGSRWLDEQLSLLLEQPFSEQARSPLEVFQEALRFPTEALQAADIPPVARDPVAVAALPGDLYDLAPASSQDLGDRALHAHLRWGYAKAAALRPPDVVVLARNLMDRERIVAVINGAGLTATAEPHMGARLAFIDLEHVDADRFIADLAAAGLKVTAYGPHVDDQAMSRARALGANHVEPRSRFFRDIEGYLPRWA